MQIKCTRKDGKSMTVAPDHMLVARLLDWEFNIGIGNGTQRAMLARQELHHKGKVTLKKTKVTLEKVTHESAGASSAV